MSVALLVAKVVLTLVAVAILAAAINYMVEHYDDEDCGS